MSKVLLRKKKATQGVILIDGYVDEPSCLGVPPYISPYARYTYGALLDLGFQPEQIWYVTIDVLRQSNFQAEKNAKQLFSGYDLALLIAGTTVPGHYLGGKPISLKEIKTIGDSFSGPLILGGPITLCYKEFKGVDIILDETCALGLYRYFSGNRGKGSACSLDLIENFAVKGARVIRAHPNFPNLVNELETYRGCLRRQHCKFCSEALKQEHYARKPENVAAEVKALYLQGGQYFRLGAQTDLFLYGAHYSRKMGTFIPNPDYIHRLYSGIKKAAPGLRVLHMDNVNPSTIATYPRKSEEIISTIVSYNTPGDTSAFGLESSDPLVIEKNNIGTTPEDTFLAVAIMNRVGGVREDGIYKLLPGVNFLYGLQGERPKTYEENYRFLKNILDEGLLLRRINLRQVREMAGYRGEKLDVQKFRAHKERVNQEINLPMLKRVFPTGVVLRNVLAEKREGHTTFGRQLGTYPILVGIPGEHPLGAFMDVKVIDHGYRSITALPYPFNINRASLAELQALPGIGKKRASWLKSNQPFKSPEALIQVLDASVDIELLNDLIDDYS